MGDFFHGWRRKTGIVTLLMACVFMAGWVATMNVLWLFEFPSGKHTFEQWAIFNGDVTRWMMNTESGPTQLMPLSFTRYWMEVRRNAPAEDSESGLIYHWQWYGFGVGHSVHADEDTFWNIRFRSIIIPLTLLSAYLLLTKSCPTNQRKLAEPIPVEGA